MPKDLEFGVYLYMAWKNEGSLRALESWYLLDHVPSPCRDGGTRWFAVPCNVRDPTPLTAALPSRERLWMTTFIHCTRISVFVEGWYFFQFSFWHTKRGSEKHLNYSRWFLCNRNSTICKILPIIWVIFFLIHYKRRIQHQEIAIFSIKKLPFEVKELYKRTKFTLY